MIFALMLGLAVLLMLPLLFIFRSGKAQARGRREAALAIHRGQLEELARDLANGRIAAGEYAGAKLEIERRLLAADMLTDVKLDGSARWFLAITVAAVPAMAFLLYLPGSTPHVPSVPHAEVAAREQKAAAQIDTMITQLRAHLAAIDPNSADASEGQALLAEALAERAGGLTPESIALFKQSLANAPANASWRKLDEQRLVQASVTQ
jgi:cytochrome c-type biogenesis protein CcmH